MRLRLFGIALFIVAAGLAALLLPIGEIATDLVTWVRGAGFVGALALFAAIVAGVCMFLPGSPLGMACGYVYGPFLGLALASPALLTGTCAAFGLGYAFARPLAARWIERNRRLSAIDRAVAKEGFKTILFLRFAPIMPFNILNYVLGATRLRFRDFALATWIGTLPSVSIWTWLGSELRDLEELKRGGFGSATGLWIAIGVTIIGVVLAVRVVRRRLKLDA